MSRKLRNLTYSYDAHGTVTGIQSSNRMARG